MRSLALSLSLLSLMASGCWDSHGRETATDAGSFPDVIVIYDAGPPSGTCPPGINPWDPTSPGSVCSPNGATCTSGGTDSCSSFMSCTCESGHWNCLVAEADPVCWCGRQPSAGDRCNSEGMACGECCPTPGGTGWPAMSCVGGHWEPAPCPAIECPVFPTESECPANTHEQIGRSCSAEGASCGDACCDSAIVCEGGTWHAGPVADCFACTSYACGDGACPSNQTCIARCGPADGVDYFCAPREPGCNDCSCIPVEPGQQCEMIDGHPHLSSTGFCG
jgi:hypothetical protein